MHLLLVGICTWTVRSNCPPVSSKWMLWRCCERPFGDHSTKLLRPSGKRLESSWSRQSSYLFFLHKAHQDSRLSRGSKQPVLGSKALTDSAFFCGINSPSVPALSCQLNTELGNGHAHQCLSATWADSNTPQLQDLCDYHGTQAMNIQEKSLKRVVGLPGWGYGCELWVGFLCWFVFYWL